jgi:hypothetical protein
MRIYYGKFRGQWSIYIGNWKTTYMERYRNIIPMVWAVFSPKCDE